MSVEQQGHLPNSGVQRHSAGEHFPYIIAIVDRNVGGNERGRFYQVLGPGLSERNLVLELRTHEEAEKSALRLLSWSRNPDAWSIAIEEVCSMGVGGVRIAGMLKFVRAFAEDALAGRSRFAQMTPGERVYAVLSAGERRDALVVVGTTPTATLLARKLRSV